MIISLKFLITQYLCNDINADNTHIITEIICMHELSSIFSWHTPLLQWGHAGYTWPTSTVW